MCDVVDRYAIACELHRQTEVDATVHVMFVNINNTVGWVTRGTSDR